MDTTALTIIGSVISIATITIAILKISFEKNKDITMQATQTTELKVKLATIEKELLEIKNLILTNNEQTCKLEKRVFILEQKTGGK